MLALNYVLEGLFFTINFYLFTGCNIGPQRAFFPITFFTIAGIAILNKNIVSCGSCGTTIHGYGCCNGM